MGFKKRLKESQNLKPHVFKPFVFPDGMIVVRDTNEQLPLFVGKEYKDLKQTVKPLIIPGERRLGPGDYTLKGFESDIMIERKMESDFYTYIGKEREKTVKKLRCLAGYKFAALVIEGMNYDDLCCQSFYSTRTPEHVRGFLTSINIRYGIHFFCHRDRGIIERWCLDRMIKFYRLMREV